MKTRKILTILVMALGLFFCLTEIGKAVPMGGAFTYQGHLYDANYVANGLYDIQFKLYDSATDGNQLGGALDINAVDVVDGYFTVWVESNHPNAFVGDCRWLEIGIRTGELKDPNEYAVLSPRQEIQPAPYALYAKTGGKVPGGIIGSGITDSIAKFTDSNVIGDSPIYELASEVAITGKSIVIDNDKNYSCRDNGGAIIGLLSIDTFNNVHLGAYSGAGDLYIRANGDRMIIKGSSGNVGIGTTSPGAKLDVKGNIRILDASGDPVVEMGEGLDYAEGFDVSDKNKIEPGTVLVIDAKNPKKLAISSRAYDSKVAGIVTGANGLGSAVRVGGSEFDCDVALAGRVYCNVDASEAAVEPGDLLTTSATPGYAMKATDYMRAQGAILGKAMEKLEKGTKDQILVLVSLQ